MRDRLTSVGWTAIIAVFGYCLAVLPFVPHVIAAVAGAIVCFGCAGFAVATATLPRRHNAMTGFAGVVASSLAVGIFGGLALNLLPSGLTRFNWATYALAIALAGCAVAHVRGLGHPMRWRPNGFAMPPWSSLAKLTLAGALLAAAGLMSANSFNAHEQPFTELWLVPDNPARSPLRAVHVELGVKSHESGVEDFTVVLDTGKRTVTERVTLEPQQVWTQAVIAEGDRLRASLYRGDPAEEPYRTVWIATR